LTVQNKKARPIGYAKTDGFSSSFSSRNMAVLGTIILVFIVTHMVNFWAVMHFDKNMPLQTISIGVQGQEQEYYLVSSDNNKSYEGPHYCSVANNPIQQQIVDEHMIVCMLIDVRFYGTNSEVSPNQWEFQLGPCEGLRAADNLLIARFLLEKIAAKHGYRVCYHPKPFHDRHGSGCHHNFSTKATREVGGYDAIVELMSRFAETHAEHIAVYGTGNEFRLTGKCETASMNAFSWGVGTRNTSMRVPNKTKQLGYGYIEDRRPAANVDPYDAVYVITKTIK